MNANDLLKKQSGEMYYVTENTSVKQCVEEMVNKHVGALVVLNDKRDLCGIISERDILKLIKDDNCDFSNIRVGEVMTPKTKLITAEAKDQLAAVMDKMSTHSIRHIVIVEGEKFVGLGSIRDVVRMLLEGAMVENKQLMDYVYNSTL